ncbi:MAG: PfkB family carbohydrate kinase [Armatimonadetes bacterium]|nr:PfkB family carbohydrate kinase [Armatimonadota bacterium]
MDVVCLGEALIDFVALEAGVTLAQASGFLKSPGGAPANVAAGAAKLGAEAAFIGKVGDDPFGRFIAATLSEAGVDTGGLIFSADHRTGLAFVSLKKDGERDFCFFRNPSADMRLAAEELPRGLIGRAEVFHFGSITLIQEPSRRATLEAVQVASQNGALISYDPNIRLALWPEAEAVAFGVALGLPYADILKVSEEEVVCVSTQTSTEEAAINDLYSRYPKLKWVAVTRGPNGASLYDRHGVIHQPGFTANSVDTTGAGDAFTAGFIVALLEYRRSGGDILSSQLGWLVPVLRFACATGAITTTRKGAIPAMPSRGQVEQLLQSYR